LVSDLLNSSAFVYTYYTFTGTATEASTTIQFSGCDRPVSHSIDDVSLTTTSVPEPATIFLLGAGLAGVGLLKRRFKN